MLHVKCTNENTAVFVDVDGAVHVHDIVAGTTRIMQCARHDDFALTHDGKILFLASSTQTHVVARSLVDGSSLYTLFHKHANCVAVSSDMRFFVTGTTRGNVYVFFADHMQLLQNHGYIDRACVRQVCISHNCTYIATASDYMIHLTKVNAFTNCISRPTKITGICFTPDSLCLAVSSIDGLVTLYNMYLRIIFTVTSPVQANGVGVSMEHLLSWSTDNIVCVWNRKTPQRPPLVFSGKVHSAALHTNYIVVLAQDKTLHVRPLCAWSDRTHYLFDRHFRKLVFHLMCVKYRDANSQSNLPRLPMAVWLEVFAFLYSVFAKEDYHKLHMLE